MECWFPGLRVKVGNENGDIVFNRNRASFKKDEKAPEMGGCSTMY